MSTTATIAAVREMLIVALMLVSPFLAAAVLSSFVVGLFQAGTRINDLTLSFVPRFIAVLLTIYFLASWTIGQMAGYIERSTMALRILLG